MAKVFLVYFDLRTGYHPGVHHGLAYIIGTLKSNKHIVYLSHLTDESDFNKTIKSINEAKPDLIGLSFTTNQKKYVHLFLNERLPAKLLIAGGVHCTLEREKIFEELPEIDGI